MLMQVTNLVQKRVDSPDDFAWLSQLRYYWQDQWSLTQLLCMPRL